MTSTGGDAREVHGQHLRSHVPQPETADDDGSAQLPGGSDGFRAAEAGDGRREPPEPRMRVIWAWAFSEANANMILSMEFAPSSLCGPVRRAGRSVRHQILFQLPLGHLGGVRPALPTLSGQILLRHVGT